MCSTTVCPLVYRKARKQFGLPSPVSDAYGEQGKMGSGRFPEIICELLKQGQMSKSAEHRVIVLLDTPWDSDGYMLGKLHQLITLVKAKVGEEAPDFARLHHDLLRWNWSSREVQLDWARALADISVKE